MRALSDDNKSGSVLYFNTTMTNKDKTTFEEKVEDWALRVIQARIIRREGDTVDTYQMIRDIDEIIAEGFHHDPVLKGE